MLIFYPADWSPVCGDELSMFEAATGLFAGHGAQLIGISVDSSWCHLAYKADRKLSFPLLADFHPKGAVAKSYGVFREDDDRPSGPSSSSTHSTASRGVMFRRSGSARR